MATLTNEGSVNGVDVPRLQETMQLIEDDARIAASRFEADNQWVSGGENRTRIDHFFGACEPRTHETPFELSADEPPLLLGQDQGPNPVEYVLHALAACLTTSLVYQAAARGIRLTKVNSHLEGDLDLRGFLGMDPSIRNGYEGIRVRFEIEGDAPRKQLEELCRVAQERSPVYDIVTHGVPVKVEMANA
jgi:uncharacterized OsmC-like protein